MDEKVIIYSIEVLKPNGLFLVNLVSYILWLILYLKQCVMCILRIVIRRRYFARYVRPAAFIFESDSALGSMTRASYPQSIITLRNETAKCRSRINYY